MHNMRDFLPEVLSRYGLAKVRPDAFRVGLPAGHETQVIAKIPRRRANLRRTPMSPPHYIDHLAADLMGMPRLAPALASLGRAIWGG
jgi:hypothetical protein